MDREETPDSATLAEPAVRKRAPAAVAHAETQQAPLPGTAPLPRRDPSRYEIQGELGRGGLGRVLRAIDRDLDRPVAIKEMLDPEESSELRFFREARITARLEHPSVVPLHDAGRWPDGRAFYVMKLVDGRRLDDVAAAAPTIEARIALLPHVIAVADAIAYAHAKSIVHRDLKPANVLIGAFGETIVIDWGLAKMIEGDDDRDEVGDDPFDSSTTRAGQVVGTPAYMAPEQARGEPSDLRSDVYALGAVLHHVLAGQPPYAGESAPVVLDRVRMGARAPLPHDVPPALGAIVARAMAAEPRDRYAHAGQLADDLRRFVDGRLVDAYRYSRRELAARWIARRWPLVAIGVMAVVGLAVTGALWYRSMRKADRLAAIARDLGRDVERFEGELRRAYTLPVTDVRAARAHVRQEMADMRDTVDELDGAAEAAGRFALGRGHLALGELDDARRELERAWSLGLRDPDAALALGLTLARQYERGLERLEQLGDDDARVARRAELERTLRDPAVRYLAGARGASTVPAEYVDAVIDLVEEKFEDADRKARAALAAAPWLYEAYDVIGAGHLARAYDAISRTDNAIADGELALAGDALGRAIEIARSDPNIRGEDCRRANYAQWSAFGSDLPIDALTREVETTCGAALAVDPDDPTPWLRLASAHNRVARELIRRGTGDPSEALARALGDIDRLLAARPDHEYALVIRAQILRRRAQWASSHGGDPSQDLADAIALLERARKVAPGDDVAPRDLGIAYEQLAARAADPGPIYARAIAACADAIRVAPKGGDGYACRAQIHRDLGARALAGAGDPRPEYRAAIDDSDAAASRMPSDAAQPTARGEAALGLATAAWLDGDDPVAHLARAIDDVDLAIKLRPGVDDARALGARAELIWARWLADRGEPLGDHLARARAYASSIRASDLSKQLLAEADVIAARAPGPRAARDAALRDARALAPTGRVAAELALATFELTGARAELARAAETLLAADDSAAALALAGALASAAGAHDRAKELFDRARAISPRALRPWRAYAKLSSP
ncbi:MAG TPA: serine/threonine-protein kinase [Kofleriaceae bacterium]|nr:serine/threonine-protein kinase [Kofleriaceae bacterium]